MFLRACILAASLSVAACGGGGGSGGSGSTGGSTGGTSGSGSSGSGTTSSSQPKIIGEVLAFPATNAPAVFISSPYNTQANFKVQDQTGTTALTNATITVNGTALTYYSSDQEYYGQLTVSPGDSVVVVVTVNGVSYKSSYTQFSTFPTITSPAAGSNWSTQVTNLISWSSTLPDLTAVYALEVATSGGSPVWPSNGYLQTTRATSYTVPAGSLSAGSDLVLVGLMDYVSITGAASGSAVTYGAFSYAAVNATTPIAPPQLIQIAITPSSVTVGLGGSTQLSATGTYSDGSTQDITAQVTWTSAAPSIATASSTGAVTGVNSGSTTVTASYQGVSATDNIIVFQPTPSPTPPLSQSVAFQIDYAHSGYATFGGNGPTFPPSTSWSVTLNGAVSYPLIAGGRIFVTTQLNSVASLYALDEATGTTLWGPVTIPAGFSGWSGAAYDQGTVFVQNGGSAPDDDGVLTAYDAASGTVKWTSYLRGQYMFTAPPTAVNGVVYTSGAGGAGTLYAVNEVDGSILWTAFVENGDQSSPAVSSDGVFVSYPCQAYKFDPISGASLWHYSGPCEGGDGKTAVYANGLLYTRDPGNGNYIFNASTGAQAGTFTGYILPAFSSQTGYFLQNGTLNAIDQSSQATLWSFQGDGHLTSPPIVIDNAVIIASSTGTVYALNATTGATLWSGSTGTIINALDEQDDVVKSTLGAGEGWLVVPAGSTLTAWKLTP